MTTPFRNVSEWTRWNNNSSTCPFTGLFTSYTSIFVVPAGRFQSKTLKSKYGSRKPGLNFKVPFVQNTYPFNVQFARPEKFDSLTKIYKLFPQLQLLNILKPSEAGRVFKTISYNDREIITGLFSHPYLRLSNQFFQNMS